MRYTSAAAFRTGLEARLLNQSRKAGIDLARLRRRVVFERLLARLAQSDEATWVLKGGMALEARLGDRARSTRDLDLALRGFASGGTTGEWVRSVLVEALATDFERDGFEFRVIEDRAILPREAVQDGWRFRIDARLAGKTFERVRVDIVLESEEVIGTERLRLQPLLGFAGIDAVEIDAIDRREHFAEKLHALTRPRVRPNSRMKGLADRVLLIDEGLGANADLRGVAERVFSGAGTHPLPAEIQDLPEPWRESYGQLANDLGLSAATLDEALSSLRDFWTQVFATSSTAQDRS